jgi:hypothetical protein
MTVEAVEQLLGETDEALARVEESIRASALPSLADVAAAAYAAGRAAAERDRLAAGRLAEVAALPPAPRTTAEQLVAERLAEMEECARRLHAERGSLPWYGLPWRYDPPTAD